MKSLLTSWIQVWSLRWERFSGVAGLLSGPVKELDETAEATVEATMEDAENLWTLFW
jgi:hypothetical protein